MVFLRNRKWCQACAEIFLKKSLSHNLVFLLASAVRQSGEYVRKSWSRVLFSPAGATNTHGTLIVIVRSANKLPDPAGGLPVVTCNVSVYVPDCFMIMS